MLSRMGPTTSCAPPAFVQLVAHPVRWGLLRELAASDRAVRELTCLVDRPQNLVSYHLRRLREGGLVAARRSSADGRDSYYSIDLGRCRAQLHAVGGALHPALAPDASGRSAGRTSTATGSRVLFLCTGNSARSPIAEALTEHLSAGTVEAASAGTSPRPLHPNAARVMAERGIDIGARRPTHVDELTGLRFDHVITLCDLAREVCPDFPSQPNLVHWSLPNPADPPGSDEVSHPAFVRVADELEARIGFLLASIDATRDPSPEPAAHGPVTTEEIHHGDPAHR